MKSLAPLASVLLLGQAPDVLAQYSPAENIRTQQSRPFFDRIQREMVVNITVTNTADQTLADDARLEIVRSSHTVTNGRQADDMLFLPVPALAAGESVVIPVRMALARKRMNLQARLMTRQGPGNNWQLVWQDEFNGRSIDTSKWSFETNCWGGGNNEQQCYTDRSDNAFIDKGKLVIKAQREDFTGPDNPQGDPASVTTLPYTSARLRSLDKGDWTYGRFEIRAKLPKGQGTWPAVWMLPSDNTYGTWAASGEIDIMEAVNLGTPSDDPSAPDTAENRVYGTLHFGRAWPGNVHAGADYRLPGGQSPADGFHTYAIEWEQGEIRWYVDGHHFATQTEAGWYTQYQDADGQWQTGTGSAPFDERFHLLLNLAVGGSWAGNTNATGIDESVFPQTLEIDYVRVYECSVNPATGQGCATVGEQAEQVPGVSAPPLPGASSAIGSGPQFMLFDDALNQALAVQSYNPQGTVSSSQPAVAERGQVFEMQQTGNSGNLFFNAGEPINLAHFEQLGKLKFDLRVVDRAPDTQLLVKIDSGWPAVSDTALTLPEDDQWHSVALDVDTLLAAGNRYAPGNQAQLDQVVNPFVLEANGPITVQVDNVRYEYDLAGTTELVVFDEAERAPFALGQYVASGSVLAEQVVSAEGGHGEVKQLTFNTNESVVYFQTSPDAEGKPQPVNVSGFDTLVFDLKVVEDPRATQNFMIKMDCGHPCSSGDFAIAAPPTGEWTRYEISIADLLANPGSTLDLTKVDTPLVIFPAWGNQQGVVLQLDNVMLTGSGETDNSPTVVTVNDTFALLDDGLAQGWSLWDCCANAQVSMVGDSQRGLVAQLDYFGPAPTVSGLRAGMPHDVSALYSGTISMDIKVAAAPQDPSANWLLKAEGADGSFAQILLTDNLNGVSPEVGQWQTYTFSLASLAQQGLTLEQFNLLLVFPDWGKATGAVVQLDNIVLNP